MRALGAEPHRACALFARNVPERPGALAGEPPHDPPIRALGEFGATITFAGNFPARLCVDLRVDAIKPRLLLLDEPLSALDIRTRAELRRDLRRHLESFRGVRLPEGTPRDVWRASVTRLDQEGDRVRVRVSGTAAIVAEITLAAVSALRLDAGGEVWEAERDVACARCGTDRLAHCSHATSPNCRGVRSLCASAPLW